MSSRFGRWPMGLAVLGAVLYFLPWTALPGPAAAAAQEGDQLPLVILPPERDINGVWWSSTYSANIMPMDGGAFPFTPEGLKAYQANLAGLADGTLVDQARYTCTPDGVPRIWFSPYPFQILVSPEQTTIIYERSHVFRIAAMDRSLPDADLLEALPYFSGHSVAHWEGETLVIESAGYKGSTFLDDTGVPHSEELTTTERLRKMDDARLELIVTVADPVTFTRPWAARFLFEARPDVRLRTQVCGEPYRDISHITGAPQ